MIQDKIELLGIELLRDKEKLKLINHWLKVMNWSNGWHYDLDIIWILRRINESGLARGSTIIDAGAGLGITQFILASLGYNVLSLDFIDRPIPKFSKNIFCIDKIDHNLGGYRHEYMEFMNYGQKNPIRKVNLAYILELFRKAFDSKRFSLNFYLARHRFMQALNLAYLLELTRCHKDFGKITFLRGTFNNIPLADNCADALVSVSAFEHNTYDDMPTSIIEFMRVVKKDSPLLITTSVSEGDDWYFKPPKAWNFSRKTLSLWFDIPEDKVVFNYPEVFDGIVSSKALEKRMPSSYKLSVDNGLPYGRLKDAKYLPAGIVKIKK